MNEEVSLQLIHQRIRNRIVEVLETLAEGDDHDFEYGAGEYFEAFFDWMPLKDEEPFENMTMTHEELASVEQVRGLMVQASDATPADLTVDHLVSSGWPARIAGPASTALSVLEARGPFSEWIEEESAIPLHRNN